LRKPIHLKSRMREELYINLNPLQRGGVMPAEARKLVYTYIDGYSVCDYCPGALHLMKRPPIQEFLAEVAEFLGMDRAILTHGCREAKFAVMHSIAKPGQAIVVDGNCHYTSYVAAERAGLKVYEVPSSGYPHFKIEPESYALTIERVKRETGSPPALALLTHVDWMYGNLVDARRVGKICQEYDVPFLLNTAYSSGRMPINGRELKADFIACSGHKSWAAGAGSVGILAIREEWSRVVLKPSERYGVKLLEILGCSVRGSSAIALMASFPHVQDRVQRWMEEVEKARWFSSRMEALGGIRQLGDRPHNHDLMRFETPALHEIAKRHRRRGYFLHEELQRRGIVGLKPGRTKAIEVSTYGLSRKQLEYVVESFRDILEKFGVG